MIRFYERKIADIKSGHDSARVNSSYGVPMSGIAAREGRWQAIDVRKRQIAACEKKIEELKAEIARGPRPPATNAVSSIIYPDGVDTPEERRAYWEAVVKAKKKKSVGASR